MDVMSVESCVQAVIGAYRDATKLVHRLRDKRNGTDEALPQELTRELDDSLALGCLTVQSQYDHDVRRFGETYARGDALAREQMKDILITLQQAIISHLREVYMDDAVLDLHVLRETSDDSRVNATVCLGQLYQRMSTATAAVKQISRTYVEEPNNVPLSRPPHSLGYSSSRSTHSSYENTSSTSYSTVNERTPAANDQKWPGPAEPRRRASTISTASHLTGMEPPKNITPGEDDVPAMPLYVRRQTNPSAADNKSPNSLRPADDNAVYTSPSISPLIRPRVSPQSSGGGDDKERVSVSHHRYQSAPAPLHISKPANSNSVPQGRKSPPPAQHNSTHHVGHPAGIHELDSSYKNEKSTPIGGDKQAVPDARASSGKQAPTPKPLDYSTLELVSSLDAKTPSSMTYAPGEQQQQPQQQKDFATHLASNETLHRTLTPGNLHDPKPPSFHSRPKSVHSTSSSSGKFGASAMRKALPPGLVERINQPPPPPPQPEIPVQPRYIPAIPSAESPAQPTPPQAPPWPYSPQQSVTALPIPRSGSIPSIRPPTSQSFLPQPQSQLPPSIPLSSLNLPSESNLSSFCKGAIRLQLASRKRGFRLDHLRSGDLWRCTKCAFSGPALISAALPSGGRAAAKREKTFDLHVRVSQGGIRYRWAFLAKCHILSTRTTATDTAKTDDVPGTFGCIFCSVEGPARGWSAAANGAFTDEKNRLSPTPLFHDLAGFMRHLEMHRRAEGRPGETVAQRMNAIVGRVAGDAEDFDINLPPL